MKDLIAGQLPFDGKQLRAYVNLKILEQKLKFLCEKE